MPIYQHFQPIQKILFRVFKSIWSISFQYLCRKWYKQQCSYKSKTQTLRDIETINKNKWIPELWLSYVQHSRRDRLWCYKVKFFFKKRDHDSCPYIQKMVLATRQREVRWAINAIMRFFYRWPVMIFLPTIFFNAIYLYRLVLEQNTF